MALINKWPQNEESFYDNKQWEAKSWTIGEPITKEKLQNLDDGIAVLATQMKAVLGEFNPSSLDGAQLNASRLDIIQKWLTAAEDGTYDLTKGSIAARLANIDTLNTTQNNRLNSIESVNSTQSTDISSLKTRAANLENRATDIETLNITQNGRLDSIESKNTEQDDRLDDIDTINTNQNTEITNLKTRTTNIESVNNTQNNRLTAIENELSGNGTGTSGSSRLDNMQTWIAGGSTSAYTGTAISARLNNMQTWITGTADGSYNKNGIGERLDSLESSRIANENTIGKLETEILGPDKDYGNSRIDQLDTGLSAINSTVTAHESRISRIETGAVAAKILNYTTTNNADSDSLILPTNSIIDKNSIAMIFLNVNTLGLNDITVQDNIATYNVKVNNNTNLHARFSTGSLLGLYRGDTNDIYMFNAPLAI